MAVYIPNIDVKEFYKICKEHGIEIIAVPADDIEPVRRGKWEYNQDDNIPYCSECMMPQDSECDYCPSCGAKMDGKDEMSSMSNLEIAKQIIKANFKDGSCGIFDTRNWVGDAMTNIYDGNGLIIDICYGWAYFEVFGLSEKDFEELVRFYNELEVEKEDE